MFPATAKKRKSENADGGQDGYKALVGLIKDIDNRMRHIEGKTTTTYVITENDHLLVDPLEEATQVWYNAIEKGKPHPQGPRRTTLAMAALKALVMAKLSGATVEVQAEIDKHDKIATTAKALSIAEQQIVLQKCFEYLDTPVKFEPEVTECRFQHTKKAGSDGKKRFVFSISFAPDSPLRHTVDFIRVCMTAIKAEKLDGPPPKGPAARAVK